MTVKVFNTRCRADDGVVRFAVVLAVGTVLLFSWGISVGSLGFVPLHWDDLNVSNQILWDIRLPRTMGAWLAGALLGLAGAAAQGVFRNPLADPFLLGSASGASFGVAVYLFFLSSVGGVYAFGNSPQLLSSNWLQLGLTGSAFFGAAIAVMITMLLSGGVHQTMRLLLGGVVVGMVLGAMVSLITFWRPELWRSMQGFMLGSTGFLGWEAIQTMGIFLLVCTATALWQHRALDAMALGETTAQSLGVSVVRVRMHLVIVIALATGAAVAQVGLVAFVGLVAPHLVRANVRTMHMWRLPLSAMMGGTLLLLADILARCIFAPQELPVGVLTAVLGGLYLLVLMHRKTL